MPIFEAFALAAPEVFGAEAVGAELGAEALAPELLGTALTTAELAGLGAAPELAAGAQGITQAGIAADAAAGGAGAGAAGINEAQIAAQQGAAQGINAIPQAMSPAQQAYQAASSANSMQGITPGTTPLPAYPNDFQSVNQIANQVASNAPPPPVSLTPAAAPPSALETGMNKAAEWAKANPFTAATTAYMGANALGLFRPSGATFNNTPYSGPLSKYHLADNFQARVANPADYQYTPRYAIGGGIMAAPSQAVNQQTMQPPGQPAQPYDIRVGYDDGGDVQGYAQGGSLSDSIAQYQKMLEGHAPVAPAPSHDVGIYYDQDPDTRYQDALTAAQIRQAKVNQRAYVSPPAAKRPTPMGKLNLPTSSKSKGGDDVEAASGGIMHSSLGGYAAGGNPRLLKGPGDGMSDNIPATINGRQPARLADGEFVVPADVVSHLGNGSTEAGAKQLHGMMDRVRKARTGNPKQGKEIKPQKYMPK